MPIDSTPTAAEINVELGRAAGAPFSLNGAAERDIAGRPSGAISFADFVNKSMWTAGITPGDTSTSSSTVGTSTTTHTASPSDGGVATYSWGVQTVTSGSAVVSAGASSASADLSVSDSDDTAGTKGDATFFCDITKNGVTKRATIRKQHSWTAAI